MIKVDKPGVTDLMIPRSAGECCGSKVPFTRKDIMEILSNYITEDNAREIFDEIFADYISNIDSLTELILNAVGDVYTREQVDTIVSGLQAKIDDLQEQIDSMT